MQYAIPFTGCESMEIETVMSTLTNMPLMHHEIKGTEQDGEDTMTANTAITENSQLMVAQPTQSIHSSVTYQPGNVGAKTVTSHQRPRRKGKHGASSEQQTSEKEQKAPDPGDQVMVPPIPAFVQQASAARCIAVLIEDSVDVTKRLLKSSE
ncbi:hypothetical protein ACTXT7_012804 [Hymenolepis weldensis]